MSTRETGGSAFPMPGMTGLPNEGFIYGQDGMTLRDYFATHASDADIDHQAEVLRCQSAIGILPDNWVVTARYMHADAMLKAREQ